MYAATVSAIRLVLFLCLTGVVTSASAAASDWKAFVGTYSGTANAQTSSGSQSRDMAVSISEIDDGFRVEWDTSRLKPTGKIKRNSYSIDFAPSDRAGIYASRMAPGLFGGRKPLDPLKGEPYVWARIEGKTMTVYAMLIDSTGNYEMQVYERTLVADGLDLHFTRYRRSQVLSEVRAVLTRKKPSSY